MGLEFPFPLLFKFNHKLANRNSEVTNDWLTKAGKHGIIHLTGQSRAEECVCWQGHLELHERIDCGVCSRSLWHSLQVFQVSTDRGWYETFQVEVDKGFLNRQETGRLESSQTK